MTAETPSKAIREVPSGVEAIQFLFEFASPYSYIASMEIDQVAASVGRSASVARKERSAFREYSHMANNRQALLLAEFFLFFTVNLRDRSKRSPDEMQ